MEFLALTPDQFVKEILKDKIGATTIVCGPDFTFGTKALGNVQFLKDNQKKVWLQSDSCRKRAIS